MTTETEPTQVEKSQMEFQAFWAEIQKRMPIFIASTQAENMEMVKAIAEAAFFRGCNSGVRALGHELKGVFSK